MMATVKKKNKKKSTLPLHRQAEKSGNRTKFKSRSETGPKQTSEKRRIDNVKENDGRYIDKWETVKGKMKKRTCTCVGRERAVVALRYCYLLCMRR